MTVSYSDYQKLQYDFPSFGIIVDNSEFAESVKLSLAIKETRFSEYATRLSEMTQGRIEPTKTGTRFDFI